MTNVIDFAEYRRQSTTTHAAIQQYFIAQHDGRQGAVFGSIDEKGKRVILRDALSISDASALLIEAANPIEPASVSG